MGLFSGSSGKAASLYDQARGEWSRVRIPTPEDLYYEIERYSTDAGIANPVQLYTKDLDQGDTELSDIEVRQNILDRQNDSLQDLTRVAEEGYTAQEQADVQRLMTQEQIAQKGSREAILKNMEERGVGGSGMELQAQLLEQQGSANRGAQTAFDIAAKSKMRALQALGAQGDLSSRMRGQEFGEQAKVATAQDSINRFNLNQEANTRAFNNNRNWNAAGARQTINQSNADKATAQRAQVGDNLKYRTQQEFNQVAGRAGQYSAEAAAEEAAKRDRNSFGRNLISGAATAIGGFFGGPAGAVATKAATTREDGGPVETGEAYMVGEQGPELIVPQDDGQVMDNGATNRILESITGMKSSDNSKLMESTVVDLQERLRNLEMRRAT